MKQCHCRRVFGLNGIKKKKKGKKTIKMTKKNMGGMMRERNVKYTRVKMPFTIGLHTVIKRL